jgi:hypothetical protein
MKERPREQRIQSSLEHQATLSWIYLVDIGIPAPIHGDVNSMMPIGFISSCSHQWSRGRVAEKQGAFGLESALEQLQFRESDLAA